MALPKLPPPPFAIPNFPPEIYRWLHHVYKWLGDATGTSPLSVSGTSANITEDLDVETQVTGQLPTANLDPVNAAYAPTSTTTLSNTGASTVISIAANTQQFSFGTVSYNLGTVDPGAYGPYTIYADDPNYLGGAVTYHFTANPPTQVAASGRVIFGSITSVAASVTTGGGYTGGTTTRGTGGKGYNTN